MATLICPICGKSFESDKSQSLPFCDERCKQIDFSRWLDEKYPLPFERTIEPSEDDGDSVDS